MRLLVELECLRDCSYDLMYYNKLQGAVYGLVKGTEYTGIHDTSGSKFFCFSNVFPARDLRRSDRKHFIVSSPNRTLLEVIGDSLGERGVLNVGDMSFGVNSVKLLEQSIGGSCTFMSGTPIVLRIPKDNFERYGIKPRQDYDYVYWRKEHSFNAFLKQIEENLLKKYRLYHNFNGGFDESGFLPLFQQFLFKKPVCNHAVINGKEVKVIGSVWEFMFSHLTKDQRSLLEFGLDTGFGELNSLGFGFMNVKQERRMA